jgi:hypothetical protein
MHFAESVANRLLNFVEGIERGAAPSIPSMPTADPAGAALEERLGSSPGGAAPNASVIEGAATGEPPLESLVKE